jgi:hypothetical protein
MKGRDAGPWHAWSQYYDPVGASWVSGVSGISTGGHGGGYGFGDLGYVTGTHLATSAHESFDPITDAMVVETAMTFPNNGANTTPHEAPTLLGEAESELFVLDTLAPAITSITIDETPYPAGNDLDVIVDV